MSLRRRAALALLFVFSTAPVRARDAPSVGAAGGSPAVEQTSDAQLLSALVLLFDPFVSPAERLRGFAAPALRDPRAVPPLVFLLSDRNPQVRESAARALGSFPDPRAQTALIERMRLRQELEAVRISAATALAQEGGASAGDALYSVFIDEDEPRALREAARRALEARFPQLLHDRGGGEVVDRSGRNLLVAGSAVLGSYALASVGALGQNSAGTTIGALGGLVVGGGSAYLLTRTGEITSAQAGWVLTGGAWGGGLARLAAAAIAEQPSTRFTLSLGLAGEALGTLSAIVTRSHLRYNAEDVALINIGGLLGADLAAGAYLLHDTNRSQLFAGSLLAAGAAGLVAGGALAPVLDIRSPGDRVLIAEAAYEGFSFGLLTPPALASNDDRREGASLLGIGLGFATGVALSQLTELAPEDVGLAWLIGGYGKLLGLAIPLLADGNDASLARGTIAGSAAALGVAAILAPRLQFDKGDATLVTLGTGLGLWHGIAFGASSAKLNGAQATGLALLGLSAGGLGTMALSQRLDPTPAEVFVLGGGAFWGNWFTLWGSDLARSPGDSLDLRPAVVAGDVGVAATALLLQRVDARRIGIANLGGLAGAGLASLGAALASKNDHTVITANLLGSALGLVGGGALAASLDLAPVPASPTVSQAPRRSLGAPTIGPLVAGPASGLTVGMTLTFVESPVR